MEENKEIIFEKFDLIIKISKEGIIVDNKEEADIKVLVARHNPLIVWHFATLEDFGWGFYGGAIKFQDKTCNKPYCGIVGDIVKDGKKEIYIEANDIDGFIAASKAFIKEQDSFKVGREPIFLGEDSEDAIAVYDYLHTDENKPYYKKNSDEFGEIVGKALRGEKYKEGDGNFTTTISGQGVNLRYKHLAPEHNQIFLDYKDRDGLPVVMGGGIWSDISAWQELGGELSNEEGKDVWLIEITGGPDMECDDCPDYTYEDLTDNVWPTYVNSIKALSGKDKIDYVGHSNGARVGLDSLTKGTVNPTYIETFIAVGVPGSFKELSLFGEVIDSSGEYILSQLNDLNENHVTISRIGWLSGTFSGNVISLISFLAGIDTKISTNLFNQYFYWIDSNQDEQPGKNLDLNRFILIYGYNGFLYSVDNDYVVPTSDELDIYNNINAVDEKKIYPIFARHIGMCENTEVKKIVRKNI